MKKIEEKKCNTQNSYTTFLKLYSLEIWAIFYFKKVMKNQQKTVINNNFEAKHNLVGFFNLLLQIDKKNNPHLYENNRNTNNSNQSE